MFMLYRAERRKYGKLREEAGETEKGKREQQDQQP